jgi:hypothetical protein
MTEKEEKQHELQVILESKNFSNEDIEVLLRLIKFYDKYENQLKEIVDREVISELWAGARLKMGKMVKWILGSFLLLVAVLQGWQAIITIFFKGGSQ